MKGAVIMKRSRRNHSSAFKAKVALQAIRGDKTLAELAQQHQVHATQISAWKQQLLEHAAELFGSGQTLAQDSRERVQELRSNNGIIRSQSVSQFLDCS